MGKTGSPKSEQTTGTFEQGGGPSMICGFKECLICLRAGRPALPEPPTPPPAPLPGSLQPGP